MATVGLDLHKRYITACALDESGTVLAEHRRLEPSLDAFGRWLDGLPQPVQVAMEATLYWHWPERHLTAAVFGCWWRWSADRSDSYSRITRC